MRSVFLRLVLAAQGLYFVGTGMWAILDLRSFLLATSYVADPFKTHTNAILFTAIGFCLIYASYHSDNLYPAAMLGIFVSAGTAAADYVYLPRIGDPLAFRVDLMLQSFFGITYWIWLVVRERIARKRRNAHADKKQS
jgi:hypothetical protein